MNTSDLTTYSPFTNSLYDSCNLDKKNQESTGPYQWVTDASVHESQDACLPGITPFMQNQFYSIPGKKVDVESELRNQTRVLSRCPEVCFDPTKLTNCQNCHNCNSGLPCDCNHCKETKHQNYIKECSNNGLVPLFTRLNKPCNLPGISINRFNPLCEDPQNLDKIHQNSFIGDNTRNKVKDEYKAAQKQLMKPVSGNFTGFIEGSEKFHI